MGMLFGPFGPPDPTRLVDGDGRALEALSDDEVQLADQLAREIQAREAHHSLARIELSPLEALQLAGLLQLALRHPELTLASRATGALVVQMVRTYFAGCPAVLDVLRRGDDPREDR